MQRLKKIYFRHSAFLIEFALASFVISTVLTYAMAPILFAPNSNYPYTVDGMGHLAKIKYIADCLRNFYLPDWFPYWYNGSTVTQYYPPLSYLLQVPVQIIFDNTMITFKYFAFSSIFIGAMGVWYTCYRFLGSWIGILAGSLYALQPFLIISVLVAGLVAQGPIFAFSPWLLFFTILLLRKPSRGAWIALCILTFMLILSHVMHAFMVCLCIGICIIILMLMQKIDKARALQWVASIALGCGLAAFWWVTGVTQLENPGIPYLLPEAALLYTANFSWFSIVQRGFGGFYFSLTMVLISLVSIPLLFTDSKNTNAKNSLSTEKILILFNLFLLILTVVFSFGQNNPLFKYIPFSINLVPGRILSLSSVSSAILTAYVIFSIFKKFKSKYMAYFIVTVIMGIIFLDVNPKVYRYITEDCTEIKSLIESIPEEGQNYEKSRFTWVYPVNSNITYFPLIYRYNMSDGWNIEGTPHNRTLWLSNIAIATKNEEYIVKYLMQWNAHSALISKDYKGLIQAMKDEGYYELNKYEDSVLMHLPNKSSYFYKQERDALAIGKGIQGLSIAFPWIVAGTSPNIEDYSLEELSKYKLIYFAEPEIKNLASFEERIKQLAKQGKTIIIEMGRTERWPILGVMPYDVKYDSNAVLKAKEQDLSNDNFEDISLNDNGQSCALSGLDNIYYTLIQKNETGEYPIVGTKKVEGENVYFVGLGMSQLLRPSIIRTMGMIADKPELVARDHNIERLLETIMDKAVPSKKIILDSFQTDSHVWKNEKILFSYSSDKAEDVVISVTYTPRWKVFIDGKCITPYSFENLILLRLPPGSHSVELRYGITWVGWIGRGISFISFIIVFFMFMYFNKSYILFNKVIQNFIYNFKQKPVYPD